MRVCIEFCEILQCLEQGIPAVLHVRSSSAAKHGFDALHLLALANTGWKC